MNEFNLIPILLCLTALGLLLLAFSARKKYIGLRTQYRRISRDFNRAAREAQNYRIASENANDGLVVQELDGRIVWVNPAYCRIMGRPAHQMIGRHPLAFALPAAEKPSDAEIAAFVYDPASFNKGELSLFRNVRGDGSLFWNQISVSHHVAPDGSETVILVCRDVTQQILKEKKLQETSARLAHLAEHDTLTGIANRDALTQFIDEALMRFRHSDKHLGLFHIDLDRFKEINDTHGHAAGDEVLKYVAQKLRSVLRQSDLVARIGGDEFVVACPGLGDINELQTIGLALQDSITAPLRWQDRMIPCNISIGASMSDPTVKSATDLLQQSDFALYDVKRNGRGRFKTYDESLHRRHTRERSLARDLQNVVRSKQLVFKFQPTFSLLDMSVRGLETLVYWDHPTLGLLNYADFENVAKQTNLVADIDFAAMTAALDVKSTFENTQFDKIRVGFNASPDCLAHPQFYQKLMTQTRNAGIATQSIVIELSEAALIQTDDRTSLRGGIINKLNQAGFITMLDDFGMGRAGLGHLATLDVKSIKIDPLMAQSLTSGSSGQKIMQTINDLCGDMGIYPVANGIETQDQLSILRKIGSETGQGVFLQPPIAEADVVGFLQSHAANAQHHPSSTIAPNANQRYLSGKS